MIKGIVRIAGAVALIAGITVSEVGAQVYTPTFMAPRASSDVGIYLSDGPGEFSVEGIFRRDFGGFDLGLRAGVADTHDLSVLVGGEYRNPLAVAAPIDLALTGMIQGIFGGVSSVGFLAGLSVGHTFAADGISFTPYIHPRAGLVQGFIDDEFDLELLADIGFDLGISQNLDLRFGIGLDTHGSDWGVGLSWR